MRLTMLGPIDDVALANGVPPRNKPGNPAQLRYLIAHRSGSNLDSLFASVLEPYKGQRLISAISETAVTQNGVPVDTAATTGVRAIKVELTNGRTDWIVLSYDSDTTYTIDGSIEFRGFFGVYIEKDGRPEQVYLNDGATIGKIGGAPVTSEGALLGTVVDFTRELSATNDIVADLALGGTDPQQLVGRTIYIANDNERNAVYPVRAIEVLGGSRYRIAIGDLTLVRIYVDSNNFSKGYVFDIAPGAAIRIPLSALSAPAPDKVTIDDMIGQVETFRASGDIQSTFADQLVYRLNIIQLLADQGSSQVAIAYMNDFLAQIRDPSVRRQGLISAAAFDRLERDASSWISDMSE